MKRKLFVLPIVALFVPTFLSGCSPKNQINYLSNEWYFTGYGSYVNGKYNTTEGGVKLIKQETPTEGYAETYKIANQELKIGDSLYFVNKNKSIRLNGSFTEGGSFSTKNAFIYEENNKKSVDILKTGKYNIQLDVNSGSALISITNGEGTTDNLNPVVPTDQTISMFEHGDYHAAIREKTDQVGLFKYSTFIKEQMAATPEDDILLNNGDFWQGTYESNANKGEALTQLLSEMNYEMFNLGNHEFDWGQENIYNNQGKTKVPFTGCNIVNYKTKELVDYVSPFTIVERGDVKVGIIGGIGPAQWTSISSTKVGDIEFGDLEVYGKRYADRLREEFGCHAVVMNVHNPTVTKSSSFAGQLTLISPKTNQRYVDAFFFGHDHDYDYGGVAPTKANVPFANSGNNGVSLGHITLNIENGVVTTGTSECIMPSASELIEDLELKAKFNNLVDEATRNKADEVVGSVADTFTERTASNLMAKATFDYVTSQGDNIALAIVNNARANLYQGEINYSHITDAFPFFNDIVLLQVSGSVASSIAKSNYCYHTNPIDKNATYIIATYDYIAFHMSQNREYDNFTNPIAVKTYSKYPSDILTDYWKTISSPLNSSDYTGENFSINLI